MLNTYKKTFRLFIVSLFSLGMISNLAFGYSIHLNAMDDAGQYPDQGAYLEFNNVLDNNANNGPVWTTPQDVYDYAYNENLSSPWTLESAGNVWSQQDMIVGETLLNLHSGTYRISPLNIIYQALVRDNFGWSDSNGLWWWEMEIQARNVYVNGQHEDYWDYKLGSSSPYPSAQAALAAAIGQYIDVTLAEGGSLIFWIFDSNSIDNSGGLSVNVSAVPAPSAILLFGTGLIALPLFRRYRK